MRINTFLQNPFQSNVIIHIETIYLIWRVGELHGGGVVFVCREVIGVK